MKRLIFRLWTSMGLALTLVGLIVNGLALAQSPSQPSSTLSDTLTLSHTPDPPVSPMPIYAQVITGNVPVYQHPLEATLEVSPVRTLELGYVWVSLTDPEPMQFGEQQWYRVNADEYVQADYLRLYQASSFRGKVVTLPSTFAWIVFETWTASTPGATPGEGSVLLERYSIVEIQETEVVGEREWYLIEDGHWIEQGMIGIVRPKPRPEGIPPGDKWIEVDLYEQTLAAYEGDRMVYATLVSSGLSWWQTEAGLFQIWVKNDQAKMSGRAGYPDYYFLEDVPWTMYFNRDFALHGAYWHDRFGIQHSHGCVNLPVADAQWLFEWATPAATRSGWTLATEEAPGTWVWVHEGGGLTELAEEQSTAPEES